MKVHKLTVGFAGALLVLLATASAQEPVQKPIQVELDPEIPWFKVEIIVFRNLDIIPGENEVFTPRVEPQVLPDAQVYPDGAIDTRMQDPWSGSTPSGLIQETESAGMAGNPTGSSSVPEFSDLGGASLDTTDTIADGFEMTGPQTLEELYFPPNSHFRLVALEELFPADSAVELLSANKEQAGNQSQVPGGAPLNPTAPLTENELARHALMHEFELADQAKRIGNRKQYQVVAHVAWIQPGYAEDQAIAFPLAELAGAASGLQGDITLYLSRYLHMQFNLIISEPGGAPGQESTAAYDRLLSLPISAAADQPPAPSPVYRMDEKRRMRSGELHYIDHPYFGALTRVSKVDPAFLAESHL